MLNKFSFEDGDRIILVRSYKSLDENLSKAREIIKGIGEGSDISYKVLYIRDDEILGVYQIYTVKLNQLI